MDRPAGPTPMLTQDSRNRLDEDGAPRSAAAVPRNRPVPSPDFETKRGVGYARLVRGQPLFICGAAAKMRTGEAEFEGAFERAFQEITHCLGEAVLGWKDVREITSFHSRVLTQLPSFSDVLRLHADPAEVQWRTFEHASLGSGTIAEIRIIASRDDHARELMPEPRAREGRRD